MKVSGKGPVQELATFESLCFFLNVFSKSLNMMFADKLKTKSTEQVTITGVRYCIGMHCQQSEVQTNQDEIPLYVTDFCFGMENHNIPAIEDIEEIIEPEADFPPWFSYEYQYNTSSVYSEGWIVLTIRNIPLKPPETFPKWVKSAVVEQTVRQMKMEKYLEFLCDRVGNTFLTDIVKSNIDYTKTVLSSDPPTKDDMTKDNSLQLIDTAISALDLGWDVWSYIKSLIEYAEEHLEDILEWGQLKRMEYIEKQIKEVLTDEEKFNILLGKAVNKGKSIQGQVVAKNGSLYDFTKYLDITQEQDGKLYLSRQALLCLQVNWQFGEEF